MSHFHGPWSMVHGLDLPPFTLHAQVLRVGLRVSSHHIQHVVQFRVGAEWMVIGAQSRKVLFRAKREQLERYLWSFT